MNIGVVGTGLQAYVAASLFASVGNYVVIFERYGNSNIDLNEPGLLKLYQEQVKNGRLSHLESINSNRDYDFVLLSGIKHEDVLLTYMDELLVSIQNGTKFILLDPSEIGEAQKFLSDLSSLSRETSVSSVPLLVREGRAINDFSRPESIVIGCDNSDALPEIKNLFYPFNRVKNVIKVVSSREAEFSCFAGNAMLATRLSFMNEMAHLAERTDVDIDVVRECIGRDPRIGSEYLYPGCGYGGKVLVEDVAKVAQELRLRSDDLGLLDVVSKINERQKDLLFRKIWSFFDSNLKGKTVAVWGAAFKPGSSSIEGAPAVSLISSLLSQSAKVRVYDPLAANALNKKFSAVKGFTLVESSTDAIAGADVLAICTEWKEFWNPDFKLLYSSLNHKAIFDGRNIFSPHKLKELGINYFGIGRGEVI